MTQLVTFEVTDGIADIRLNRAAKHNSLTLDMFHAIVAAGEALHTDATVRAAVLSGEGPSFCAGLDLELMQAMIAPGERSVAVFEALTRREGGRPDNVAQRVSYVWKTAPVPVVAALEGAAYGGGFQLALGCDFRIAAPGAKLSVMEIRYGLVPDMGITQTLPALVRADVAKELVLTGRVVEADEALALGLVTRVSEEPLAAAFELARTIAGHSPDAVRRAKRLLNEASRMDAHAALALEEALQLELVGSPNQLEAVAAAMARRAPVFV